MGYASKANLMFLDEVIYMEAGIVILILWGLYKLFTSAGWSGCIVLLAFALIAAAALVRLI